MPRRYLLVQILGLVTVSALSCSNPFRSDCKEVVGLVSENMIEFGEVLQAPARAERGTAVAIQITTGGSTGCTRIGRTRVDWITADSVVITPYDESKWGTDAVCNANFAPFTRTVSIRFLATGRSAVSVRARLLASDSVAIVVTSHVQVD
jgi:hypothetical protein